MEQNISLCIIVMSLHLSLHGNFPKLSKMLCNSSFQSPFTRIIIIASLNVMFITCLYWGLPWWLRGQESACNAGDANSDPGLRRFPGEGNGNPVQYSCLGNPMDRGTWQDTRESDNLVTKQQQKERSPHNLCSSFQFRSVAQMCRTLGDPMDCSRPGLPVHHQLPEFTQTHVH